MTAQKMDEIFTVTNQINYDGEIITRVDASDDLIKTYLYIDEDGYEVEWLGIRFQDVDTNEVGDIMDHISTQFEGEEYEDTGDYLNGVSAVSLNCFQRGHTRCDEVYGDKVAYIIAPSNHMSGEYGMDEDEIIISQAKVLAKIIL